MNVTTRRVAFLIASVALVAALTASTAGPAFAKKPGGNGKPDDDAFTIKTNLDGSWGFWGTFRAQGAIEDTGYASYDVWDYDVLDVNGEHGSMLILIFITHGEGDRAYGTFWIFEADGAYADLVDVTGAYTQKLSMPKSKPMYPEERPKWHLSQILEGSLPEE
ncbi:MAG: hypothetical protein ACYTG0_24835 [Planctomycetota bacterium]|jgi:hypothetical protein